MNTIVKLLYKLCNIVKACYVNKAQCDVEDLCTHSTHVVQEQSHTTYLGRTEYRQHTRCTRTEYTQYT